MSGHSEAAGQDSEHFFYTSNDPHTAIPDWVPFATQMGTEARNLISATLVLQKRGHPPTRRELAQALDVDERSIYRWLQEIASAGALSTRRAGRRRLSVFHRPKPDRAISDRAISDRPITDRPIRMRDSDSLEHVGQQSHESPIPDQAISDRPVGVGVGHDSIKKERPTTNDRTPLKTELACWLKRAGMNAAREFDDPALDYWTYRRFVEEKRGLAWEWRQIVSTLRQAPLERDPLATPFEDRAILDKARQIDAELDTAELASQAVPGMKTLEQAQAQFDKQQKARGKR